MENKYTIEESRPFHFGFASNVILHKDGNGQLFCIAYGSTPEESQSRASQIANADKIKSALEWIADSSDETFLDEIKDVALEALKSTTL